MKPTDEQDIAKNLNIALNAIRRVNDNYQKVMAKAKQPETTVTAWEAEESVKRGWYKSSYSFNGLPDVDRVINETLDKGALAIKIECDEAFYINSSDSCEIVWIAKRDICMGWNYGNYRGRYGWHVSSLESAITKYLSKPPEKE